MARTCSSRDLEEGADVELLDLTQMSDDDVARYMNELLLAEQDVPGDAGTVDGLLEQLGSLFLATNLAAAYLKRHHIPMSIYLALLQSTNPGRFVSSAREGEGSVVPGGSPKALAGTWLTSLNVLLNINPEAADLVSFISQIEPDAIPLPMLPRAGTEEDFAVAISTLCAYGFLRRSPHDSDSVDMPHPVHRIAGILLETSGAVRPTLEKAAKHIVSIFPPDTWENRATWRRLLPHATRLLRAGTVQIPTSWHLCELAFWAGRCLRANGDPRTSIDLVEPLVTAQAALLPEDDPILLSWQHSLAITHDEADSTTGHAVRLLEHVVRVRARLFPPDHQSLLASQHTLARAYHSASRPRTAIALLEPVVAQLAQQERAQHAAAAAVDEQPNSSLLLSRQVLAAAYQSDARHDDAIALISPVIAAWAAAAMPDDHPAMLSSRSTLAAAYDAAGRADEAAALYALIPSRTQDAPQKSSPARDKMDPGCRLRDAVVLLRHVVAVQERCLPADSIRLQASRAAAVKWQYALEKRERV